MKLVFCCGCDRSGTTLFAREMGNVIQNSFVVPEAYFFNDIRRLGLDVLETQIEKLLRSNPRYLIWGTGNCKPDLDFTSYETLFLSLVYANFTIPENIEVIIDSTPTAYLWKLGENFGNAKFFHIKRDARSVVSSLLGKNWGPTHSGKCIDYWVEKVTLAHSLSDLEIQYENFILNEPETVSKIKNFLFECGFTYDWDRFNTPVSLSTLPEFTREQHKKLSEYIDPHKAEIKSDYTIDFYYSNNLVACLLNNSLGDYDPTENLVIKSIETLRSFLREIRAKLI